MAITKKPTAQERAAAREAFNKDRAAAKEVYRSAHAAAKGLPLKEQKNLRKKASKEYRTAYDKILNAYKNAYESSTRPRTVSDTPMRPEPKPVTEPAPSGGGIGSGTSGGPFPGRPIIKDYGTGSEAPPGSPAAQNPLTSPRTTIDPNEPRRPEMEGGMRPPGDRGNAVADTFGRFKKGGMVKESAMMKKEGRGMAKANMQKIAGAAVKKHEKAMHGMKSGGFASGHKKADGIAQRGKTKCKIC